LLQEPLKSAESAPELDRLSDETSVIHMDDELVENKQQQFLNATPDDDTEEEQEDSMRFRSTWRAVSGEESFPGI